MKSKPILSVLLLASAAFLLAVLDQYLGPRYLRAGMAKSQQDDADQYHVGTFSSKNENDLADLDANGHDRTTEFQASSHKRSARKNQTQNKKSTIPISSPTKTALENLPMFQRTPLDTFPISSPTKTALENLPMFQRTPLDIGPVPQASFQQSESTQVRVDKEEYEEELPDDMALLIDQIDENPTIDGRRLNPSEPYGLAVYPTEDVYVRGGSQKNTNYGSSSYLSTKMASFEYTRKILMKFNDLPNFVAKSYSVKLRLYVKIVWVDAPQQVTVKLLEPVSTSALDESTVTWTSAMTSTSGTPVTFDITGKDVENSWVEVEISSLVNGQTGNLGLLLESNGDGVTFSSKEHQDFSPVIYGLSVKASEASFVRDGNYESSSFGSDQNLFVKNDSSSYTRISLLKFNTRLPEFFPVLAAKLRLYVSSTGSDSSREVRVARLPTSLYWTENSVTWQNSIGESPDYEMIGSTSLTVPQTHSDSPKWVEIDISDLIVDGVLNLALEVVSAKSSQNHVIFGSDEMTGFEPHIVFDELIPTELRVGKDIAYCMDLAGSDVKLSHCDTSESQLWAVDSCGFIRSRTSRTKCLQLNKSSGGMEIADCDNELLEQKWVASPGGEFRSQEDPTKCIGLDASPTSGGNIVAQTCTDDSSQVWMPLHNFLRGTISSQMKDFTCLEVVGGDAVNGAGIGMAPCDGSKKQKWRYNVEEGLIYSGLTEDQDSDDNKKCIDLQGGNKSNAAPLILYTCIKGHKNQMWRYYNNVFSLSVDNNFVMDQSLSQNKVHLYTYHGGLNQRFLVGPPGRKFFKKSITSQKDDNMCVEATGTGNGALLVMAECDNSAEQQWEMDGDGLIRSVWSPSKCIDLRLGDKSNGGKIQLWSCSEGHKNQMWKYKDGVLWLAETVNDGFDTDMAIDWGSGGKVHLWSYHGGTNQRWLVRDNLDRKYSGNYIRIRNDSMFPAQCSLGQVGPLYWGVIYPGEEFFRETGAVHFTTKCQLVLDGKETIDAWDAILPVVNIVANVLLAVATAGLSIKGTIAAQSATAINTVGSAAIAAAIDQTFEAVLQALVFAGVAPKIKAVTSSAWSSAKGLLGSSPKIYPVGVKPPLGLVQRTKLKVTSVWNEGKTIISHKRIGIMPEEVSSPVIGTPAGPSTFAVLTDMAKAGGWKTGFKFLGKMSKDSLGSLFNPATMYVSESGVYANGKDFILRGGPSSKHPEGHELDAVHMLEPSVDPSSVIILEAEPLRLDIRDGLPAKASCTSNSDCMMGACGRMVAGGSLVCCPEGDYGTYAGYDYCINSALPSESCMFDEMCLDGYCSGGTCIEARVDGSDCELDVHCLSGYCKGNDLGLGTGTCTPLLDNGKECNTGYDGQCRSKACGRKTARETDDIGDNNYICCPSGDTVTVVWEYCTSFKNEGGKCKHDDMCRSGFCNGSNGMGWVGSCYEPIEDGEKCLSDGNDRSCISEECGRDVNDDYICCPNGAWTSGTKEYCRDMADVGEKCPGSAYSNDNYCKNNKNCGRDVNDDYICCPNGAWTSGTKEYCRDMADVGEKCPGSADYNDNYCKNNKNCGRDVNDDYICCPNGAWTSGTKEYCRDMADVGEKCPGSADYNDNYCKNNKECGKKSYDDGTYVCCRDGTFVPDFWSTDVCKRRKGERCNSKEDAECAGSLECGRTTRYGDYKCCDDTWLCDIFDSDCTDGRRYCDTYG